MKQQPPKRNLRIVLKIERSTKSKNGFGGFAAKFEITCKLEWSESPKRSKKASRRSSGLRSYITRGFVALLIVMVTGPIMIYLLDKYLDWILTADIIRQIGLNVRPQQVELLLDKALDILLLVSLGAAGVQSRP